MCCKFDTCGDDDLILRQDIELAQVSDSGAALTSLTAGFRCTNPTKKLHLTLEIYAKAGRTGAGDGPQAHDYTNESWQLYAMAVDGDQEIRLNAAFVDSTEIATARSLPDSRDIFDGVKLIEGVVSLTNNNNAVGDVYKVVAFWEPIDSAMSRAERLHWFAKCQLAPSQSLQLVASGE